MLISTLKTKSFSAGVRKLPGFLIISMKKEKRITPIRLAIRKAEFKKVISTL